MAAVDEQLLLTFLATRRRTAGNAVVHAIYSGLETRITRGDFSPNKTAPESAPTPYRGLTRHLERGGAVPIIMLDSTDNGHDL